jgi:sterol 3beta-glucosyltransferase
LPQPSDWQHNNHVTGYWFLDDKTAWQPSARLLDFLAAGPAPVYVGFGSMQTRNPGQMMETVLKALQISGQRGILLTGGGGLSHNDSHNDLPDEVFQVEFAPHDWLFPRMAAVVHHGGAGTMAASLRAGVPSVMIPFFGDQPFWGRRFFEMGIIPEPMPRKRLTAERLAAAINTAVNDTDLRSRVVALSARIRADDGLEKAVSILQQP